MTRQTYYVDPAAGDDANDGLTPSGPFKTYATREFAGGDTVLFKRGCVIRDIYPASEKHPQGAVEYQYIAGSNPEWKGAEIHDLWRKRWNIENAFGFMTDNWGLGKWQIRNPEVYRATIQFMVLTSTLSITRHSRAFRQSVPVMPP